jgi:curli production assembly/transport component CsgF
MKSISRAAILPALLTSAAGATEIVYTPINPSFGGNPLNGPVLLNIANAVNRYKDPSIANALAGFTQPNALTLFTQQLQSLVFSRTVSSIIDGTFKSTTIDTPSFTISITDNGGGNFTFTTTDKSTGASTSFQVSNTP